MFFLPWSLILKNNDVDQYQLKVKKIGLELWRFEGNGKRIGEEEWVVDNPNQVPEDDRRKRMSSVKEFLNSFSPGIQFIPTYEELVYHYLINKVFNKPRPPNIIYEVDIYNCNNPEQLASTYFLSISSVYSRSHI